jgi:hypothetical protein
VSIIGSKVVRNISYKIVNLHYRYCPVSRVKFEIVDKIYIMSLCFTGTLFFPCSNS